MSQLNIQTTRFGDIQVEASRIITFVKPILGFEDFTQFVILDHAPNSPFQWLQSIEDGALAFVVTNPKLFGIDYEFILPQETAELLDITEVEDALVLTIVNVPNGNPALMTANLLGPLVIHKRLRKGCQVVLADTPFSTRERLLQDEALTPATPPGASSSIQGD